MVLLNEPMHGQRSRRRPLEVAAMVRDQALTDGTSALRIASSTAGWPGSAEMILSAIEAGQFGGSNRRTAPRKRFRVMASLRLFSDSTHLPGWTIYTRDIHARGLGFITSERLPLGHGGVVELPTADGKLASIPCTLLRCREAAPGWFEGSLYFNRDQPQFGG